MTTDVLTASDDRPESAATWTELLQSRSSTRSAELVAATADIEATLRDIVSAARRAYPTVTLAADAFIAYLGERLPADVPLLAAIQAMHTADLYLACACTRGDVCAFAAFDDHCLRPLDRALVRIGLDAHACADLKQDLRELVLVGAGGRPRIAEFVGRGDLRGWVRVMAVRWALQRRRRSHRELPAEDDELLRRIAVPAGPELDPAKTVYLREFQRAFDQALRSLSDHDRTLLRQHYIDGLTIDELAGLYRVHRATAARLIARTRARLIEAARVDMLTRLDVPPHALDSILRLIRSQIEITLRAIRHRG